MPRKKATPVRRNLDVDPEFVETHKYRDKWAHECSRDDADELRYQRGELLRVIVELQADLESDEIESKIRHNDHWRKEAEKESNRAIAEVQRQINEIDAEIQEFLESHFGDMLELLEALKEERSNLKKQKAEALKEYDDANAHMRVIRGEYEERIAEYTQKADECSAFAAAIDLELDKKQRAAEAEKEKASLDKAGEKHA